MTRKGYAVGCGRNRDGLKCRLRPPLDGVWHRRHLSNGVTGSPIVEGESVVPGVSHTARVENRETGPTWRGQDWTYKQLKIGAIQRCLHVAKPVNLYLVNHREINPLFWTCVRHLRNPLMLLAFCHSLNVPKRITQKINLFSLRESSLPAEWHWHPREVKNASYGKGC
jgi:hypothetical protein